MNPKPTWHTPPPRHDLRRKQASNRKTSLWVALGTLATIALLLLWLAR
jgi:hypothetical protein